MVNVTRIVFLVCTYAFEIGRVFLPLIANILFVSIYFTVEKAFVRFFGRCVIFELNYSAYVE